ncbi:MAG: zinc ribbon domain-containing protein [Ruminococcus sp.]|nr:zinc ribbon domain-containing protein [Ruminococcus sp.]
MFCSFCGCQLPDNARFCRSCGANLAEEEVRSAPPQPPKAELRTVSPVPSPPQIRPLTGPVREGVPAPGFSDRKDHPEILAAVKKNRSLAKLWSFFIVPLPLIGFIIYGKVTGKMDTFDSLLYGGGVSGIFLMFAVISFVSDRAAKSYDAVVKDKRTALVYRHNDSNNSDRTREYTTFVITSEGKERKIVEREGSRIIAYNYLPVGEHFRYHPHFAFPYELYDKSKAPYICCVSCGTQNQVEADRCKKCNLPLLK